MEIIDTDPKRRWTWVNDLLLLIVLLIAGYLRFTGSDWGNLNIQHPDENFLSSVTLANRLEHPKIYSDRLHRWRLKTGARSRLKNFRIAHPGGAILIPAAHL
jgi:hypothetical protein